MREISDTTLAKLLKRRLQRVGAHQLFLRVLGPNDVTYVSAHAVAADGRIVEVKATALEIDAALLQLFQNLDQATDKATEEET